jgi:exosortase
MAPGMQGISADTLGLRLKANRGNLILAALGFLPLLWVFLVESWNRPAYQFFPMALFAAALLASRAVKAIGAPPAGSPSSTRFLVVVAGVVCLFANLLWSPWLGFIAFLLGVTAILWGLGGKPLFLALVPAILMLVAILPPPLGWDQSLTLWLRSVAVHVSCGLLDWLRITFVRDGNTIQLPGKTLFIEEACSGINSFVLCNAFCLFWILWQRRSYGWLVPAMLATSCFVVLGNIIRITGCSLAFSRWHLDLLDGWPHEAFGLVLLLGYCVLVMSTEQFLVFLTQPVPEEPESAPPPRPAPAAQPAAIAPPAGPILGSRFAGLLLAILGLGVFAFHIVHSKGRTIWPGLSSSLELKLSVPDDLAGWRRVNSGSGDQAMIQYVGLHSSIWHFQRAGRQASLAVDYPLNGFHDVQICYTANGWLVSAEDKMLNPAGQDDLHAMRLTMNKPPFRHAYVFQSVVDEHGRWLSNEEALVHRLETPPAGYRIQLITEAFGPIPDAAQADAQALFLEARQTLVPQIIEQLRKPAAK